MKTNKRKKSVNKVKETWLLENETRKVIIIVKEKKLRHNKVHVKRSSFVVEIPGNLPFEEFVETIRRKLES